MRIKFLMAFLGLMSSTQSYSNEKILIPSEYKSFWVDGERGYTVDRDFFNNTEQVVFMFSPKRDAQEDTWFTNCFNNQYMGIEVFSCITQNKDFAVLTNDNGKGIVFNLHKSSKQNQEYKINFKIDNSPIGTLEERVLPPGAEANFLILDLMKGKKLTYSWETSTGYSNIVINLVGFKESIEFATKMLKLNSR
ncbi:hypothetical protein E5093_05200 [Acinetobacter indicus]|uniref:hypothetical protein n=1 Tax=Acinetobacter indicus TaxID=756892 RepID=UPI00159F41B5|nr:hypothetical protein [Acinetobacter indicus]QLB59017.1 hypothetical protein E5093_05200 [Acinetobacter indicus]